LVDDLALALYQALTKVIDQPDYAERPHPVMCLRARIGHDQLLIIWYDPAWTRLRSATVASPALSPAPQVADAVAVATSCGLSARIDARSSCARVVVRNGENILQELGN
jgi:hypothetical protein